MEEETVDDEMMIHMNGPENGEFDNILKLALDKNFNGKSWHFTTQNNIFKTHGKAVTSVLSKKSKLPPLGQYHHQYLTITTTNTITTKPMPLLPP